MPLHPDCSRIDNLLEAFIDDDLPLAEREQVERHLKACSRCSTEYQQAAEIVERLRSLPIFAAPDSFPTLDHVRRRWYRGHLGLALAASLLFAVIISPVMLSKSREHAAEQDVQRSLAEARYAFSIVAQCSERSHLLPGDMTNPGRVLPKINSSKKILKNYLDELPLRTLSQATTDTKRSTRS